MTSYRFPSFGGLKAFYAVASAGSAVKAAKSLGISASSISHQLKAFESELGVRLIENRKGKYHLTADGARYFLAIEEPLTRIHSATEDIRSAPGRQRVSLTLTPSFAANWLMPRMRDLAREHPDLELNLMTTTRVIDLTRENIDLAIRRGNKDWPGCIGEPLLRESVVPVLAPELWKALPAPDLAVALTSQRVLVNTTLMDEWDNWCRAHDLEPPGTQQRFNLETYELTIQAARDGLGIALGRLPLVNDLVESGELLAPFEEFGLAGYFLLRRDAPLTSAAKRLYDWLLYQRA